MRWKDLVELGTENERIVADGQRYVRRCDTIRIGPFDTGLAGKERWYQVSDDDTDALVVKAALGGWFGLNRFAQGEIGAGVLYVLTCGCAGVLPAVDILQMVTGTMSFEQEIYVGGRETVRRRQRFYLPRPERKLLAWLSIPLTLIVGVLAWRIVYQGVLPMLFDRLLPAAASAAQNGMGERAIRMVSKIGGG